MELTVVLDYYEAMEPKVVLDYYEAMELTVVLDYYEAMETYSRIGLNLFLGLFDKKLPSYEAFAEKVAAQNLQNFQYEVVSSIQDVGQFCSAY
jgi:hypothetical protein